MKQNKGSGEIKFNRRYET